VPISLHRACSRALGHSLARVLIAVALVLITPVSGPVTRGFDPGRPFEGDRHRGVDLTAAPGTPVRAACTGPVVVAGRVGTSGGVVTLRCGPWRVTHMPLATIAVRSGAVVSRGTAIGTAGASPDHAGLHLGVRRDGTRFGYEDPLRFLARPANPVPLGRAPRPAPRGRPPRTVGPPRAAPRLARPRPAAPRLVRPRPAGPLVRERWPAPLPLAPWPAWAGLALVLAGAGLRVRARRRAYSNPVPAAAER
jgi:hypothetical protein